MAVLHSNDRIVLWNSEGNDYYGRYTESDLLVEYTGFKYESLQDYKLTADRERT